MTLTGTFNVGDVITYQNFNPSPDYIVSYEVKAGDTLTTIASALAAKINAGPNNATSSGATITTNHGLGEFGRETHIMGYQVDRVLDFASGSDKLQLSATDINRLLSTVSDGSSNSCWSLVSTPSVYAAGNAGGQVSFLDSSGDFSHGGVGGLLYDTSTGILYLDQNGDTYRSGGTLGNYIDDVAIVDLGASTALAASDIVFVA